VLNRCKLVHFLRWAWIASGALLPVLWRPARDTYLFLPINGAGLGHVSRALAVAKELRRQKPEARIVFLTTSIAVHLVYREGFVCHHVPPAALLEGLGAVRWNRHFYRCVVEAVALHRPGTLVFDGSAPYLGLQRVMKRFRTVQYIWVKRGLYKTSVDQGRLDKQLRCFQRVIVPAEFGEPGQSGATRPQVSLVPPIVGMGFDDLVSPLDACTRLRLDPARPRVYVQLGAGNINGIADVQARVVRTLQQRGYQVVVGQSPISLRPTPCDEADREIVDYPNSRYFAAFDFAVLAAGYNSVCEAVALKLPAIFLPNHATQADDQTLRASMAARMGPFEVVPEFSEAALLEAIHKLQQRIESGESFSAPEANGAAHAAAAVIGGRS
jgi:UDP:flavonoid glycosyltransferase YjiC (YdhE family)